MIFVIITVWAVGAILAIKGAQLDNLSWYKGILGLILITASSVALGIEVNALPKQEKEQPKYKQEIVYSLKDGKYLPTDTLYIEIK